MGSYSFYLFYCFYVVLKVIEVFVIIYYFVVVYLKSFFVLYSWQDFYGLVYNFIGQQNLFLRFCLYDLLYMYRIFLIGCKCI